MQITIFGDITGDLIDTTDFNEGEKPNLIQAGLELQKEGKIKPKFVIVHFVIPQHIWINN